jgi:ketosteroid isomerase-like protein
MNSSKINVGVANQAATLDRRSLLTGAGAGMIIAAGSGLTFAAAVTAATTATDALSLARQWIERLNRRDQPGLSAILADDFLYSAMGRNPPEFVLRNSRAKFLEEVTYTQTLMRKPVVMKIVNAFAGADDRAVIESEGHGEMEDGFVYENSYCFLFQAKDGKIKTIHDYCCTHTSWLYGQHRMKYAKEKAG